MALLTVGYSSVASADTGTVTKEEERNCSKDKAKKKKQLGTAKSEVEKKQAAQVQEKNDMAKKRKQ